MREQLIRATGPGPPPQATGALLTWSLWAALVSSGTLSEIQLFWEARDYIKRKEKKRYPTNENLEKYTCAQWQSYAFWLIQSPSLKLGSGHVAGGSHSDGWCAPGKRIIRSVLSSLCYSFIHLFNKHSLTTYCVLGKEDRNVFWKLLVLSLFPSQMVGGSN